MRCREEESSGAGLRGGRARGKPVLVARGGGVLLRRMCTVTDEALVGAWLAQCANRPMRQELPALSSPIPHALGAREQSSKGLVTRSP
jgi:hypothetical protein